MHVELRIPMRWRHEVRDGIEGNGARINWALQDFEWVSVTAGLVPGRGRGSRFRASRSDPTGPCLAEAFRNSFGRGCAQPRCLSQFRLSI